MTYIIAHNMGLCKRIVVEGNLNPEECRLISIAQGEWELYGISAPDRIILGPTYEMDINYRMLFNELIRRWSVPVEYWD